MQLGALILKLRTVSLCDAYFLSYARGAVFVRKLFSNLAILSSFSDVIGHGLSESVFRSTLAILVSEIIEKN